MAAYEYLAMCSSGRRSRGVQEADSLRQARQLLRERNLIPLQVKPARGGRAQGQGLAAPSGRGLGAAELAMLTR